MMYTIEDFLNRVRRHICEHETRGTIPPETKLDYINEAHNEVCSKIMGIRNDFLITYVDVTLNGSISYDLPHGVERVIYVDDISGGVNYPKETQPILFEDRFNFLNGIDYSNGVTFSLYGGKLNVPNLTSGVTLRVYYSFTPKGMGYFTASSSTSNTVVAPTTFTLGTFIKLNDFYNGMFLLTNDGQLREVIDFEASTRTFTVSSAWDANPGASTVVNVTTPIWPRFQDLIHLVAGYNWRCDLEMDTNEIRNRIRDGYITLEESLLKRYAQKSRHIRKIER